MIARILVLLLLGLLPAGQAAAQSFPPFSGFVVDSANVIPPAEEEAITRRLDALQQATGHQFVVATIPDLQGYPIEDYGYRLGRSWGVGLKDVNNAAILLIAPNEKKVRIEVGYGLEPVLTDAFSSMIIDEKILPRFKEGKLPEGIVDGANAVADQLAAPDAQAQAKVKEAAAKYDQTHRRARPSARGGGPPLGLIFWGIVLAFVVLSIGRGRRGRRGPWGGRRYGGSNLPILLWTLGQMGGGSHRSGGWGGGGGFGGGGSSGGGGWMGGGFSGGGGGSFGGGGASGSW